MTTNQRSVRKEKPTWLWPAFRTAVLGFILFMLAFPIVGFFLNAFAFRWFYPQLIPNEFSMQAWERIFNPATGTDLIGSLGTSIFIAVTVTLASLIIGMPTARALGMYKFKGKRFVEFLILAPIIVPGIAYTVGLNINFLQLGLAGSIFGVMLVHLIPVMPYVVLTLSGVFANYNADFEAQARTLGAGPVATFRLVTLPAIFPGLVVAGLFAFLVSWSQYILTLLIGGGKVVTIPLLVFNAAFAGNNAITAAISLVFIAPAVLILVLTSRFLSGRSGAIGGFGKV
jgi:putative spermidine/putrescine transport system permease protein